MLLKLTSNRQFQNSVVGNVGITVIKITSGESRVSRRYTLDRRNTQVRRRKKSVYKLSRQRHRTGHVYSRIESREFRHRNQLKQYLKSQRTWPGADTSIRKKKKTKRFSKGTQLYNA